MDETSKGIVLRVHPLSDTSLIVHWITSTNGRLTTVAKGAKRPKSPHRGKLDLLFESDFTYRKNKRSNLHILREVYLKNSHTTVSSNIRSLSLLAYGTHFLEKATEPDHPMPGVYTIFSTLIEHLNCRPPEKILVYAFEIKILNELGLAPAAEDGRMHKDISQLIEKLGYLNWEEISQLKPSHEKFSKVSSFLESHIAHHLNSIPKGRVLALGF
tara:strand:+ start:3303 stop:3944 length:642 start_codon:yes stop_codon:yes gene_type:complete